MTQPDPITLLLRLRAECVRLANEVEMMADYRKIGERKPMAERIGRRLRDVAMAPDMAAACERTHLLQRICHANNDGECTWMHCPQILDGFCDAAGNPIKKLDEFRNCPFDANTNRDAPWPDGVRPGARSGENWDHEDLRNE